MPFPSSKPSRHSDEALLEDNFSEWSADVINPPQCAPPLRDPECAFCHSKTGTLKRCLSCNSAKEFSTAIRNVKNVTGRSTNQIVKVAVRNLCRHIRGLVTHAKFQLNAEISAR